MRIREIMMSKKTRPKWPLSDTGQLHKEVPDPETGVNHFRAIPTGIIRTKPGAVNRGNTNFRRGGPGNNFN
jgi:hypothetical protein